MKTIRATHMDVAISRKSLAKMASIGLTMGSANSVEFLEITECERLASPVNILYGISPVARKRGRLCPERGHATVERDQDERQSDDVDHRAEHVPEIAEGRAPAHLAQEQRADHADLRNGGRAETAVEG